MKEVKYTPVQGIANALLLNASFIDNPGLMNGKMGIAIYFFHLARQTNHPIYEDYAGELIDEIYEEINVNTPAGFENGLAGIGWGIEHLVQEGFIEAESDEVLEEFDNRIFKELIYNAPDEVGILNGIVGLGVYFLKRVQNSASGNEKIPTLTNKQTLIHLIDELERRLTIEEIEKLFNRDTQCSREGKQQVFDTSQSENFDLLWDFPVMIWFLSNMYQEDIFNVKVEKIIRRLTGPVILEGNFPKQQNRRLLMAVALEELKNCAMFSSNYQTGKTQSGKGLQNLEQIETTIRKLFVDINRETIKTELFSNNTGLRYGVRGIEMVYRKLYQLTGKKIFKEEALYWQKECTGNKEPDNGFAGFTFENQANAFGLLEGLAGIGLMSLLARQFNHLNQ